MLGLPEVQACGHGVQVVHGHVGVLLRRPSHLALRALHRGIREEWGAVEALQRPARGGVDAEGPPQELVVRSVPLSLVLGGLLGSVDEVEDRLNRFAGSGRLPLGDRPRLHQLIPDIGFGGIVEAHRLRLGALQDGAGRFEKNVAHLLGCDALLGGQERQRLLELLEPDRPLALLLDLVAAEEEVHVRLGEALAEKAAVLAHLHEGLAVHVGVPGAAEVVEDDLEPVVVGGGQDGLCFRELLRPVGVLDPVHELLVGDLAISARVERGAYGRYLVVVEGAQRLQDGLQLRNVQKAIAAPIVGLEDLLDRGESRLAGIWHSASGTPPRPICWA
mmetsp:Transcript_73796/g.227917  ORF Transcript_73796/g.227917 Transcript_73796/m.227917 type:complete len:332 (+) Transcript_73796:627-1622(+)